SPRSSITVVPPRPPSAAICSRVNTPSPPWSTARPSPEPGITPPRWNSGRRGALIVLPPMPGTQLGTDHDKLPIVEFHALLTALNAARNGARMMSFSRENPDLIRPGMSKMNSPSLRALPITQSIPARHASFTNFTAALNAETILSQFLTMNRTASPMGPVMIANNSGQFFLIQFHTALTG